MRDTCDPGPTRLGLFPGCEKWSLCESQDGKKEVICTADASSFRCLLTFSVCGGILDIIENDIIFKSVCVCVCARARLSPL